jgi:translocation and assembly module TamA
MGAGAARHFGYVGAVRALLPPLCLLLLAGACATGREVQPEGPRVVELSIEGTKDIPEGDIKERILTSEAPWYRRLFPWLPVGEDPRFDSNAFQADLRRIERLYQAQGYYQAQVVDEEVLGPDGQPVDEEAPLPEAVRLRLKVREGEPTRIESLDIDGLEGLSDAQRQQVEDELPLQKDGVFLEESWEGLKLALASRLREMGFAEASVEGEALVDVETQKARVRVVVEPGRRYVFGKIFVATDARPTVSPARIIEQARGALKEGTPFSESALAEAQARVFRMGVFGAVKVNRGLVNREAGTVPVVIDVREAPFHSIRLGGGVGFDAFRSEVRALGEYTDRNFLGGLRRFTAGGRVGYAFVPSVLDYVFGSQGTQLVHAPVFDLSVQLEQPRILFRDVSGQVEVYAEKGLEQAFSYWGGGGKLGFIWQPSPTFSFYPSYNLETYYLTGTPGVTGVDPTTRTNLTLGCPRGEPECTVALSYLEQTLEWDRRNDPLSPSRGYFFALSLQEAGGPLQGTYNYLRVQPEARYYLTVADGGLTLASRVRVGTLIAFPTPDEVRDALDVATPIVARFFSGGANSMRGFNSRRLSPLQQVERGGAITLVPIGGLGLFESSVEARYNLTQSLVVASFLDAGTVTARPFGYVPTCGPEVDPLNCKERGFNLPSYLSQNLHYAVGLGLRYLTPVGPLRLDLAYRLPWGPPLPVTGGRAFEYNDSCFGLGGGAREPSSEEPLPSTRTLSGSPEGRCVFHLSIGEAF